MPIDREGAPFGGNLPRRRSVSRRANHRPPNYRFGRILPLRSGILEDMFGEHAMAADPDSRHLEEEHIRWSDLNDTNIIPRVMLHDTNVADLASTCFFRDHPLHDTEHDILGRIQRQGLLRLMDEALEPAEPTQRRHPPQLHRKRHHNQIDADSVVREFMSSDDLFQQGHIMGSSFLQPGLAYSISNAFGIALHMKLLDVSNENRCVSGTFETGGVSVPFAGEVVDFASTDLRCSARGNVCVDASIFDNILRNDLYFQGLGTLFGRREQKGDSEEEQLQEASNPFYLDQFGYMRLCQHCCHRLEYPEATKFPNSSLFHQVENACGNKGTTYKVLAKWFDLPPFNEFINTPSPPTPPNGKRKCVNNPENLLVCSDCTDLMQKNFLFLKLEVDVQELLEQPDRTSLPLFNDMAYKRRRRCRSSFSTPADLSGEMDEVRPMHHRRSQSSTSTVRFSENRTESILDRPESDSSSDVEPSSPTQPTATPRLHTFTINPLAPPPPPPVEQTYRYFNTVYDESSSSIPSANEDDNDNDNDEASSDGGDWFVSDGAVRLSSGRPTWLDTLLFERDASSGELHPSRVAYPSVKLYSNSARQRLKLRLVVSINRITGDLYMIPCNLDKNNWSSEENDGELFYDYETFEAAYRVLFGDSPLREVQAIHEELKTTHPDVLQRMQKMLLLKMVTTPALMNSLISPANEYHNDKFKSDLHSKRSGSGKTPQPHKRPKKSRSEESPVSATPPADNDFDGDFWESLICYFNDNVNFGFDPKKVMRLKPHSHNVTNPTVRNNKGSINCLGSFASFRLV